MRSLALRTALACLLLLSLSGLRPAAADDPVRILLYGDSITQGSSGDWTWRYFLDRHLHESGTAFDLVGPSDGLHHVPETPGVTLPLEQTFADPDFDHDSAAVWGQSMGFPTYQLGDMAQQYRPDVIVSMIGLNDLGWLTWSPEQTITKLRGLIVASRAADPGVDVVLVRYPNTWYDFMPAYNAQLGDLATALDTPDERVVATDVPVFAQAVDTWDGTHPSTSGAVKISAAVENALAGIGVGAPVRTLPVVPDGPTHVAGLTALPGIGEVDLAWAETPGASEAWVELRDLSAGDDWSRLATPFPAGVYGTTVDGLADGDRYEFRLRPAKGTSVATSTSAAVQVIPGPRPGSAQVTGLTVAASGALDASWPPAANATRYAIRLTDLTTGAVTLTGTTSPSWHAAGLVNGHRLALEVRADNGIIEGAWSSATAATVPLLAPARAARTRSPHRDRVRATASRVAFATGYRVTTATARGCRTPPRAAAFRVAKRGLATPAVTLRSKATALWVRWYAERAGVPSPLGPASTGCVRVR